MADHDSAGRTSRDDALLALLAVNARTSVADLARRLGLSRSTVQDRLKRLEESGVIAGYTVRLAARAAPGVRALIMLEVEPRRSAAIVSSLKQMPNVEAVQTVSGKYDLIVHGAADTTETLDRLIDEIGLVSGVRRTESAVVLSTRFDRRLDAD